MTDNINNSENTNEISSEIANASKDLQAISEASKMALDVVNAIIVTRCQKRLKFANRYKTVRRCPPAFVPSYFEPPHCLIWSLSMSAYYQ